MDTVPEILVQDLPADAVILDVREPEEWAAGHVEGATHVPLGEVPQRLGELPDADPLYVICRSGNRSGRAVAWLGQQGVETVNIAGGMRAWAAAGRPMVSDAGEPAVL
jgi:rhodanese-related sulfurtransferase